VGPGRLRALLGSAATLAEACLVDAVGGFRVSRLLSLDFGYRAWSFDLEAENELKPSTSHSRASEAGSPFISDGIR
jgi:hypothetical protein